MEQKSNLNFSVTIPVTWGEMDSFGHVNNIYYLRYFESARIAYFEKIGFADYMKETMIGPILAETSCTYRKPVQYPDNLTVSASVIAMRNTSFTMQYEIISEKLGLVASGSAVIVVYDYRKGEKYPIPQKLREAVEKLENNTFS